MPDLDLYEWRDTKDNNIAIAPQLGDKELYRLTLTLSPNPVLEGDLLQLLAAPQGRSEANQTSHARLWETPG
ncbi:MAG: hypothetical protein V1800_17660 [Candidatus Latescibacterota bacterium]